MSSSDSCQTNMKHECLLSLSSFLGRTCSDSDEASPGVNLHCRLTHLLREKAQLLIGPLQFWQNKYTRLSCHPLWFQTTVTLMVQGHSSTACLCTQPQADPERILHPQEFPVELRKHPLKCGHLPEERECFATLLLPGGNAVQVETKGRGKNSRQ